jgi:tetrapyrrole methylase family protein/MazG family protein
VNLRRDLVLASFAWESKGIMGITVVGLGPGSSKYLTREAWEILSAANDIYLRTERHPAMADLPEGPKLHSFDYIYQSEQDFDSVYRNIVGKLLELGGEGDIVYAVPGNPFVGESTVIALLKEAALHQMPVKVVSGLSFIEPVLQALGHDALDGLQVADALSVADSYYPSLHADQAVMLGQVYNRFIAGEVKQALSAIYPDQHPVSLVHMAGEKDEVVEHLPLYKIDRSDQINHLTSLFIPALPAASTVPALAETVAVLRSPNGCPWDIEQTPQSMREGFLEEAYEVLDAIDRQDNDNLREELGDMLYHIVMQAQMASEGGDFILSDVISEIETKLKRRHPHVWGDWEVNNTAEVLANWELLKKQEKGKSESQSLLDDILKNLPALSRSQKIQNKVGKAGFDWPDISGVYEKVVEEIDELKAAGIPEERTAELGDLLFVIVNLARHYGVEAESALREANERFEQRFRLVEGLAGQRKQNFKQMSLEEMNILWEEAKETLAKAE